nr:hypothetical protein [Methanosarcina mazei]
MLAFYFVFFLLDLNYSIEFLTTTQSAEKIILDTIYLLNTQNLKLSIFFLHTKNQPASGCIGKCRYGLVGIFRNLPKGPLALKIVPLEGMELLQ